jgi:hypothetical protein
VGASSPNNYNNLLNLLTTLTGDELCTIWHDECITLAFTAATSLFLSYRLRCQLTAMLASSAFEQNDFKAYDDQVGSFRSLTLEYQAVLAEWTGKLNAKLDELSQSRRDQVHAVHYYDTRQTVCNSQGGAAAVTNCYTTGDDGYMFEDNVNEDGSDGTSNPRVIYSQ